MKNYIILFLLLFCLFLGYFVYIGKNDTVDKEYSHKIDRQLVIKENIVFTSL